jgi:FMN-dependent NADH-azoreductase
MRLLRIECSPYGEVAISRRLTQEFVQGWLEANPGGAVITRDLTVNTLPTVTAAWVSANYTPKEMRSHEQNEILRLSTELIAELAYADEYVIGIPIHNFGPPSCFKLWIDQIVTPSSVAQRPLAGKRATFAVAAGRVYAAGSPDAGKNHLVPWLRTVCGSLGATDMQFVFAEGTKEVHVGHLDRGAFLAPHIRAIRALFAQIPAQSV